MPALRWIWVKDRLEGVSTRRVDDLVKALGCDGISKPVLSLPKGVRSPASARNWTRWWRVSWAGIWVITPIPIYGWMPCPEGPGNRSHRQCQCHSSHGGERRGPEGDPRDGRGNQRGWCLLAGLPAFPERQGTQRRGAGDLRCPPWVEGRRRHGVGWCRLAFTGIPVAHCPEPAEGCGRPILWSD